MTCLLIQGKVMLLIFVKDMMDDNISNRNIYSILVVRNKTYTVVNNSIRMKRITVSNS